MTSEYDSEAIASMQAGWAADQAELICLREINVELLDALKEGARIIRLRSGRSISECKFLDASDAAIAKAKRA